MTITLCNLFWTFSNVGLWGKYLPKNWNFFGFSERTVFVPVKSAFFRNMMKSWMQKVTPKYDTLRLNQTECSENGQNNEITYKLNRYCVFLEYRLEQKGTYIFKSFMWTNIIFRIFRGGGPRGARGARAPLRIEDL